MASKLYILMEKGMLPLLTKDESFETGEATRVAPDIVIVPSDIVSSRNTTSAPVSIRRFTSESREE